MPVTARAAASSSPSSACGEVTIGSLKTVTPTATPTIGCTACSTGRLTAIDPLWNARWLKVKPTSATTLMTHGCQEMTVATTRL
jgi:hypothetical protein